MKVVVSLDHRFLRTPDGVIWCRVTPLAYPFWTRYLDVFEDVEVLARVIDVDAASSDWRRADGQGVQFTPLPNFRGGWHFMKSLPRIKSMARSVIGIRDAVIVRVPSPIAGRILAAVSPQERPYGAEIVGDPYDVFAPRANQHPLRAFARYWFVRELRSQCSNAYATAYVTSQALQRRYPSAPGTFSTHYSTVDLQESAFRDLPRRYHHNKRTYNLIFVGTLAQLYKAPEVLIEATAECIRRRLDISLKIIGDGQYRVYLERYAFELGIGGQVTFVGTLSSTSAIQEQLDQADLFVLPSRQEGLPRAMIEAMARGLPCIGSSVGGIPELLAPEDLVPPNLASVLAEKIDEVLRSPLRMEQMSARNLEKAREYSLDVLRQRRNLFYRCVREVTEGWYMSLDTERRTFFVRSASTKSTSNHSDFMRSVRHNKSGFADDHNDA